MFKSFALLRKHCKSHFWILNFCTLAIGVSNQIVSGLLSIDSTYLFYSDYESFLKKSICTIPDLCDKTIEAFRTPEGEMLLNCYGLCSKERREWRYDFFTRLETDNLFSLIKYDLSEKDKDKININKRIFLGVSE